jgi:hypothetical protein
MDPIFQLIRMVMVPIPVILWTLTWPFLLLGAIATVPVRLLLTTVLRLLGLPFVFIYAAIDDEKKTLDEFISNWGVGYDDAFSLVSAVPISRIYVAITTWCESPKKSDSFGVVAANVLGAAIIACIVSETLRTIILGVAGLLIILIIWCGCS